MAVEKIAQSGAEVLSTPMLNLDFIYYLIYLFFKWISSPFTSSGSSDVGFLNMIKFAANGDSVAKKFFAFDENGNPITAVYNKFGDELSSGFDKFGNPVKLFDEFGNPITKVFDEFGELIPFPYSKIGSLVMDNYESFGNGIGALYDGYSLFTPPHGFEDFGGVGGWFENLFTNPYCESCPSFADMFFGGVNTYIYGMIILTSIILLILKVKGKELGDHESILYDTVYDRDEVSKSSQKSDRWNKVLELIKSDNENDWKAAIFDADNLLEEALKDNGFVGSGVGERLKNANFDTLQNAWAGHKVRNSVAHDPAFKLSQREAKMAVVNFGKVFSEFYHL